MLQSVLLHENILLVLHILNINRNFFRAEEQFGMLRNVYGFHSCHLLVINSKPKKSSTTDVGLLPAPDPWLRFLPRKPNKVFSLHFILPRCRTLFLAPLARSLVPLSWKVK